MRVDPVFDVQRMDALAQEVYGPGGSSPKHEPTLYRQVGPVLTIDPDEVRAVMDTRNAKLVISGSAPASKRGSVKFAKVTAMFAFAASMAMSMTGSLNSDPQAQTSGAGHQMKALADGYDDFMGRGADHLERLKMLAPFVAEERLNGLREQLGSAYGLMRDGVVSQSDRVQSLGAQLVSGVRNQLNERAESLGSHFDRIGLEVGQRLAQMGQGMGDIDGQAWSRITEGHAESAASTASTALVHAATALASPGEQPGRVPSGSGAAAASAADPAETPVLPVTAATMAGPPAEMEASPAVWVGGRSASEASGASNASPTDGPRRSALQLDIDRIQGACEGATSRLQCALRVHDIDPYVSLVLAVEDLPSKPYFPSVGADSGSVNLPGGYSIKMRAAVYGRERVKRDLLAAGFDAKQVDVLTNPRVSRAMIKNIDVPMAKSLALIRIVKPDYESIARDSLKTARKPDAFDSLNAQQQAALTYAAYNTGAIYPKAAAAALHLALEQDRFASTAIGKSRQALRAGVDRIYRLIDLIRKEITPRYRVTDASGATDMVSNHRLAGYVSAWLKGQGSQVLADTDRFEYQDRQLAAKFEPPREPSRSPIPSFVSAVGATQEAQRSMVSDQALQGQDPREIDAVESPRP